MRDVLDRQRFTEGFDGFKRDIRLYSGKAFTSFQTGLSEEWEGYKSEVRSIARARLGFERWKAQEVGRGRILGAVISSIEIREVGGLHNNLVAWEPRPRQPSEL